MKILLVAFAMLLTSCTTAKITCWSEKTGHINYMGQFEMETTADYVVNVADGVRDFYPKRNCQLQQSV
jgi:hypothetical protein